MNRIAIFEKVSFEQFKDDLLKEYDLSVEKIKDIYDAIKLPKRATVASAGYDFYLPYDLLLKANESNKIVTGIRCRMDQQYVLLLFPRSSLGFKYRMQLDNTVGVIDADYYNSDNQGHIMIKVSNDSHDGKEVLLKKGSGFAQGIFLPYGITIDDEVNEIRKGGFGSTDK